MLKRSIGLFAIILFLIIMPSYICEEDDYRPSYPFSDEVFSLLPRFPFDFFNIKMLFDRGDVSAFQLGEEYLQPELIPNWDYWALMIYGDADYSQFGRYGISFYPSFVEFKNVEAGDYINFSVLFRADWGIKFYQGCRIFIPDVDGLRIRMICPDYYDVVLCPTYPRFVPGWLSVACFNITIMREGSYRFTIHDDKPSKLSSIFWSEQYGENYTDVGSLTYAPLIVTISPPEYEQAIEAVPFWMQVIIGCIFLLLLLFFIAMYILRRLDEKREKG